MKQSRIRFGLIALMLFVFGLAQAPVALAQESEPPTITAPPLVIEIGDSYDPLDGVILQDDVDTPEFLLTRLEYGDKVDPNSEGVSMIYYHVTDSDENYAELERPVFVLSPDRPLIYVPYTRLSVGDTFDPLAGVIAWDLIDGDISADVTADPDSIDTSVPGEHGINYQVTDSDNNTVITESYVFVDYPREMYPVITAEDVMIATGTDFDIMSGVTATDLTDGDLTDQVELDWTDLETTDIPGLYEAYYYVMNSLGLDGYTSRQIMVLDPEYPGLWAREIYLETGWDFDPLEYATAYDMNDGDITSKIIVLESNVDTTRGGEYYVTYQVTDSDGNTVETTTMVWVEWSREMLPQITAEPIYLLVNSTFVPGTGVSASDTRDGDLTDSLVVEEEYLDLTTPGQYFVRYSVTNSLGATAWAEQMIYVLESSLPVLNVYDFSVPLNGELNIWENHFEAYDVEDGDLREQMTWDISAVKITRTGTYPVTISVTDSDGNTTQVTVQVTVIDYTYPQLDVYDYYVELYSDFDPLNYAYAWDNEDGELSDQIQIRANTVKTRMLGTYHVTYSVTDSDRHTTTKTVSVEVIPAPFYQYVIFYQDARIPLSIEESEEQSIAFLNSETAIPAGAEVKLALYFQDEQFFEVSIPLLDEVIPGVTYMVEIIEEGITLIPIAPHLWNGFGFRTSASKAELRFNASAAGTVHYAVGNTGGEIPEIDLSDEGIPVTTGANTISIKGLNPKAEQTVYIILDVPVAPVSNTLEIQLPKLPSGQSMIKPNRR